MTMPQEMTTPSLLDEIPIALDMLIERMGITDTTAWRWRRDGVLKTENIYGRLYVSADALREFNRRMKAGEFSKKHVAPKKKKAEPDNESSLTE
jgi:hypothetical protein